MKRKVVKHGPSTYIISLPSKWVKHYNIKKGDELDVVPEGNTVLISSGDINREESISIDVSNLKPRLVDRFLARTYQKGFDKVKIKFDDIKILDVIQKKVHELIGYELMEQNNDSCLIQSISSNIQIDFNNSLKKAFLIVKQMGRDIIEAYEKNDKKNLENVHLADLEVNRLTYFCLRQINKEQVSDLKDNHKTHVLYYLIEILEDLGDAYKKMASLLATVKAKKSMVDILKKMSELLDVSTSYFYSANKEKANKAYELDQEIQELISICLSGNNKKEEILAIIEARKSLDIIYHFTTMRLDFIQ